MNRRKFLLNALAGVVVASSGGAVWLSVTENQEPLSIDFTLKKLDNLLIQNLATIGSWDLYQIYSHCAQSVEFSITGYPEHKPALFKSTIGKLAFSAFSAKGKMTYGLEDSIPGAAELKKGQSIELAYQRLISSLINFKNFNGTLSPHFAYGVLTKAEYERAHVMHINNHFSEVI